MGTAAQGVDEVATSSDSLDDEVTQACIDACVAAARACEARVEVSSSRSPHEVLLTSIRAVLDCADICETTAAILARPSPAEAKVVRGLLLVCAAACRSCADRGPTPQAPQDDACVEACLRCEQACRHLLGAVMSGARTPGSSPLGW